MGFQITYRRLFEVDILHEYFLNQDGTPFSELPAAEQAKLLKKYDIRETINITPLARTAKLLTNYGLVFRTSKRGSVSGMSGRSTLVFRSRSNLRTPSF